MGLENGDGMDLLGNVSPYCSDGVDNEDSIYVKMTGDDVLYLVGLNDRLACLSAIEASNIDLEADTVLWFNRFVKDIEREWWTKR